MAKVAQIAWSGVPKAIDVFGERFGASPQDCLAYGRMALSVDRVQMAAIAARALALLGHSSEAEDLADAVCERAYFLADRFLQANETVERVDCLKAAYTAADGRKDQLDRCAARIDEVLKQQVASADGDRIDLGRLLDFTHVEPDTLSRGFDTLVDQRAHAAAARVAEHLRDQSPTSSDPTMMAKLRSLCGELISQGDLPASAGYLRVLRRMVDNPETLAPLPLRLARSLTVRLNDLLRDPLDWGAIGSLAAHLAELEPDSAVAARAQGLCFAHDGQTSKSAARLDDMLRIAPRDWKWVLLEARRLRLANLDGPALTLYTWLKRSGNAERESDKVIFLIRRERVRYLRGLRGGSNVEVLAAAEAVLEIDPKERNALVAGARALVRMKVPGRARSMLLTLIADEPNHPVARQLLAPIDQA